MKLLAKLAALFNPPPAPVAAPPLYPDTEFLDAVMQQARQKKQDEQAARTADSKLPKNATN